MATEHSDPSSHHSAPAPTRRPVVVAAVMTALIGAFYLLREHWAHVAGSWPYLLLLACPVMHLFHGHGGHRHHGGDAKPANRSTAKDE